MSFARAYALDRQQAARRLYETAAVYLNEAKLHPNPAHRAWWLAQAEFFQRQASQEAAIARKWLERVQ